MISFYCGFIGNDFLIGSGGSIGGSFFGVSIKTLICCIISKIFGGRFGVSLDKFESISSGLSLD